MASQKIFVVAAPRSGAGLFHELSLFDQGLSETDLSKVSLVELAARELGKESFASHELLGIGLTEGEKQQLVSKLRETSTGGSPVSIDYHPGFVQNVDLLVEAFPDARFVFVARNFVEAVSSGIGAWQSGQHVSEPELPTWWGTKWSFPLIPNWIDLVGEPIGEIVARQFVELSATALSKLEKLPVERFAVLRFEDLLSRPEEVVAETFARLGIAWEGKIPNPLPGSSSRSQTADLAASGILDIARIGVESNLRSYQELSARLAELGVLVPVGQRGAGEAAADSQPSGARAKPDSESVKVLSEGTPLKADFAGAFPELLTKAKASLVFTAYNSGLVGTVRADGNSIDTGYLQLAKPMGLAVADSRLAISTLDSVNSYQMHNQLAKKIFSDLDPDVLYVPQSRVHTGALAIHDMAFGTANGYQGLWFINSAFSCLSVMHNDYSFVPKWRPKWISGLAYENRCHLNGLAMVDGAPKYVTSLSQSDEPRGWREHKGTSGVIVDVTTDRVVASGLSMPHSPRWHKNKLFFLESGKGSLARVDHRSGEVTTIATLPGFTRGLAFIGDYALVGLSQVRESVFKDLPVTATKQERNCGIWVVDTRSGNTVATLKFDGVIQELFDIAVVENSRWPIFIDRVPETSTAFVLPNAALKDLRKSKQE